MNKDLWPGFIKVVKKEVVPALGCTEPVSVALAAAIAADKLKLKTKDYSNIIITAAVSPNLMKNGMGVGVPGTGMVGLPVAAAVGAIGGLADAGLEVLKNITDADVAVAKEIIANDKVHVGVADVSNPLYAKVTITHRENYVSVTIADAHTNITTIEENGITTFSEQCRHVANNKTGNLPFEHACAEDIYDFALNAPLDDIAFIEQAGDINNALSEEGLEHEYGLQIGATFQKNVDLGLLSGGLLTEVLTRTSSASDARMDGAMKPAMSNSGSGNQGIAATMPVVVTADFLKADREKKIRALMLSNLMAIYIKSYQNKLSALCGATTAAMGSAAGITWLLGGDFTKISYAISSMIGDVAGVICDGAKTACAMKVSSSAGSAVKASLMAINGIHVTGNEGIVANDVDTSIRNLSALANGAMTQTDAQILDIMVNK